VAGDIAGQGDVDASVVRIQFAGGQIDATDEMVAGVIMILVASGDISAEGNVNALPIVTRTVAGAITADGEVSALIARVRPVEGDILKGVPFKWSWPLSFFVCNTLIIYCPKQLESRSAKTAESSGWRQRGGLRASDAIEDDGFEEGEGHGSTSLALVRNKSARRTSLVGI